MPKTNRPPGQWPVTAPAPSPAVLAMLRDISQPGSRIPPADLHRVKGRSDRAGKFSKRRGDDLRPMPVRPPFMLIHDAIQWFKKRRARRGDSAADNHYFRIGDVDHRHDRTAQ